MRMTNLCGCLLSSLLAGCATFAAPGGVGLLDTGPGYFGGTHIAYESTIRPGHLYRTASGPLAFGAQIQELCPEDFKFIKVDVGPDENEIPSLKREMSGNLNASASGINLVQALLGITAGGELALDADFTNVHSNDAQNLAEIQSKLNRNKRCRRLITQHREAGQDVFLAERTYRAEKVELHGVYKANADFSVGKLKFVTAGPELELNGARDVSTTRTNTVVELRAYRGE